MFSKTCRYAIRAILFLAVHTDEDKKIGVDDISEGLDIPRHFLAKILQQLTRHDLASSSKGRNGGFYMSQENKSASLLRVIESIDGKDVFTSCILGLPECSGSNPCTLHEQVKLHRIHMLDVLDNQSIEEIAKNISKENLKI